MTRRERAFTFGNQVEFQQDSLLTSDSANEYEKIPNIQSDNEPFYNRIPCFKPVLIFLIFQVLKKILSLIFRNNLGLH